MQKLLAAIEQGDSLTDAGDVHSLDDARSQLEKVHGVADSLGNNKVTAIYALNTHLLFEIL